MNGPNGSHSSEAEIVARVRASILSELTDFRAAVMAEFGKSARKVDELHQAVNRVAERQIEQDHTDGRYRRRLKDAEDELERVSKQVDGPNWRRDPAETTGVHNLVDVAVIKARQEDMRDEGKWWKRNVVGGIAIALVITAVTGCVAFAAKHVTFVPTEEKTHAR